MKSEHPSQSKSSLWIFEGGPLHPLWVPLGFVKPIFMSLDLRIVLIWFALWLPLLLLSIWNGTAWAGSDIPFLRDFEAQSRLLLTLPLLLWSEREADHVLIPLLNIFEEKQIVRKKDSSRFHSLLQSTDKWSHSHVVTIILIVLVGFAGHRFFQMERLTTRNTWYGEAAGGDFQFSPAGIWYVYVAIPIFQYILYRWIIRLILWWRLLLKVASLDLHYIPTHPDRAGGIGFLSEGIHAFVPFLISQGVFLAGALSNRIFHDHRTLQSLWPEMAIFFSFDILLILGPLTAFTRSLVAVRRRGLIEYSVLASKYVSEFERKWIKGEAPSSEALVGSADIQSLADLANGSNVVEEMKLAPFGRATILKVLLPLALPVSPLIFTVFPANEILPKLIKLLL